MVTRHHSWKMLGSEGQNSIRININSSSLRCKTRVGVGSFTIGNQAQKGIVGGNGLIRKSGFPTSTLKFGLSYQLNYKRDKSSMTPPRTRPIGEKNLVGKFNIKEAYKYIDQHDQIQLDPEWKSMWDKIH